MRGSVNTPGLRTRRRAGPSAARASVSGHSTKCSVIAQVLKQAVCLTEQQSQPQNDEAQRVLKFFMSSLFNPQLRRPAPLDLMRSMTTLVPHYAEGVIYPLDTAEVSARTGIKASPGEGAPSPPGSGLHPAKGDQPPCV